MLYEILNWKKLIEQMINNHGFENFRKYSTNNKIIYKWFHIKNITLHSTNNITLKWKLDQTRGTGKNHTDPEINKNH